MASCDSCRIRSPIAIRLFGIGDRSLCLTCLKKGGIVESPSASTPSVGPAPQLPGGASSSGSWQESGDGGTEGGREEEEEVTGAHPYAGLLPIVFPSHQPHAEHAAAVSKMCADMELYANAQRLREERAAKTLRTSQLLLDERARLWRVEQAAKRAAAAALAGTSPAAAPGRQQQAGSPVRKRRPRQQALGQEDRPSTGAGEWAQEADADIKLATFLVGFCQKYGADKRVGLQALAAERREELLRAISMPGEVQQVLAVRELLRQQQGAGSPARCVAVQEAQAPTSSPSF